MKVGDVIQFNERHKWCGSLGIITEVRDYAEEPDLIRYMVAVPIPEKGPAFIYVMAFECALEYIGDAVLTLKESDVK